MANLKSVLKAIVLVISGLAIVVVGGFMMGAIARLWGPKGSKRDSKQNTGNIKDDNI